MDRVEILVQVLEKISRRRIVVDNLTSKLGRQQKHVFQVTVRDFHQSCFGVGMDRSESMAAEKALSEALERLIERRLLAAKIVSPTMRGSSVHKSDDRAQEFALMEFLERKTLGLFLNKKAKAKAVQVSINDIRAGHRAFAARIEGPSKFVLDYLEIQNFKGQVLGNGFAQNMGKKFSEKATDEALRRYAIALHLSQAYSPKGCLNVIVPRRKAEAKVAKSNHWFPVQKISMEIAEEVHFACALDVRMADLESQSNCLGNLRGLISAAPKIKISPR